MSLRDFTAAGNSDLYLVLLPRCWQTHNTFKNKMTTKRFITSYFPYFSDHMQIYPLSCSRGLYLLKTSQDAFHFSLSQTQGENFLA